MSIYGGGWQGVCVCVNGLYVCQECLVLGVKERPEYWGAVGYDVGIGLQKEGVSQKSADGHFSAECKNARGAESPKKKLQTRLECWAEAEE